MKHYLILFLLIILISSTCSNSPRPLSHALTNIELLKLNKLNILQKSILKITSSAYYENFYYSYPKTHEKTISQESLLNNRNLTTNSVAGTGLILYQDAHKQLLLTCYHVLDFKDTLRTYYLDNNKQRTKFLSSLSIKTGENILIYHENGRSTQASAIAIDEAYDLALVETRFDGVIMSEFPFQGIFGNADKIQLGQETYLLGFPKGFFMVTRGLASPSPFRNKFMVDAPFNRGFSGGVVISFIDVEPYYQFIGMANSIAFNSDYVIVPPDDPQLIDKYENMPYDGELFVKELKFLNYGMTFVIKSNIIIEFIKRESGNLRLLGYDLSTYFK